MVMAESWNDIDPKKSPHRLSNEGSTNFSVL